MKRESIIATIDSIYDLMVVFRYQNPARYERLDECAELLERRLRRMDGISEDMHLDICRCGSYLTYLWSY